MSWNGDSNVDAAPKEHIITGEIENAKNRNAQNFVGRVHIKADDGELYSFDNVAAFGGLSDYIKPGTRGTFYILKTEGRTEGGLIVGMENESGNKICDDKARTEALSIYKPLMFFSGLKGIFMGGFGALIAFGLLNAALFSSPFYFNIYMLVVILGAVAGWYFSTGSVREQKKVVDPEGITQFMQRHGFSPGTN